MTDKPDRVDDAEASRAVEAGLDDWIRSVGETAAPVLAGFSITVVIVVSDDADHFRWPGAASLLLTVAAIALIGAVQCAKYARATRWSGANRTRSSIWWTRTWYFKLSDPKRTKFWRQMTRGLYHLGLSALLAGLAFALAPQHAGGTQEVLRWAASGLAFAACAIETTVILTAGRESQLRDK